MDSYMQVASVLPKKGDTFMFSLDKWLFNGSTEILAERYPKLHSYAMDNKLTAAAVFSCEQMTDLFQLPLSVQAFEELKVLVDDMRRNPLFVSNDTWIYS
jgi:hypothetical protein